MAHSPVQVGLRGQIRRPPVTAGGQLIRLVYCERFATLSQYPFFGCQVIHRAYGTSNIARNSAWVLVASCASAQSARRDA
jgi:hypothetical protein